MTPQAAADLLNSRFQYRPDGIDSWRILDTSRPAVRGDCDDYAVTIAWLIADQSPRRFFWMLMTGQFRFIFCLTKRGVRHFVLSHRGRYIDNIQGDWFTEFPYRKILTFRLIVPLAKLALGKLFGR